MHRLLTLLLLIAMVGQPLPAQNCGTDTGRHSTHDSPRMSQAMGELVPGTVDSGPGCCGNGIDQESDCGSSPDCGNCYVSAQVFATFQKHSVAWKADQPPSIDSGPIVPSHDYPPYRPPIS